MAIVKSVFRSNGVEIELSTSGDGINFIITSRDGMELHEEMELERALEFFRAGLGLAIGRADTIATAFKAFK